METKRSTRLKNKPKIDYKESSSEEEDEDEDEDNILHMENLEEEIEKIPKKFIDKQVTYIAKLYIREYGNFFYKIGYTNNIKQRIKKLNSDYGCCEEIEIHMLSRCNGPKLEK